MLNEYCYAVASRILIRIHVMKRMFLVRQIDSEKESICRLMRILIEKNLLSLQYSY